MNKKDFRTKMVNTIIFRSKISNKETIDLMHRTENLDEIMQYYITVLPKPETLKDCHNQFAWIRKYSLPLIKRKGMVSNHLYKTKQDYNQFVNSTGTTNTADFTPNQLNTYQLYLDVMAESELLISILEDMILKYNGLLEDICDYYDEHNLPLLDFCQLLNMNVDTAKLNIKYEYDGEKIDHRHYKYLFGGIEDDRSEDGWKQNLSNNMPLFHLVQKNMVIFMNRNKELKQKVNDFMMHNMGMAEHMMTMKEDTDGNKTLEKYYPPLRIIK